ncbi:hypothetical protein J3B02_002915 [Coemansia erecta]|nr:hypothetical protein J3B02_002915 [Coemansia erecta]
MHFTSTFSKVATASLSFLALASASVASSTLAAYDKRAVPRIAGGNVAPDEDFQFVGYIRVTNSTYKGLTCTGSLIAPNVVLTAAHCVYADKKIAYIPDNFRVKFTHKTPTAADMLSAYKVSKVIPYPNFSLSEMNNDIAILILQKDVSTSEATPVKLFAGDSGSDTPVTAAGFGITDPNDSSSVATNLMEVDLHLGQEEYCKNDYANYQHKYLICTDGTAGIDTCLGDSGGPLATPFENSNGSGSALIGITSFAPSSPSNPKGLCAKAGGSGYYTRVSTYISWIASSCGLEINDISVNNSTVTKADTLIHNSRISGQEKQSDMSGKKDNESSNDKDEQGTLDTDEEDNTASDKGSGTSTVFVDPPSTHIVTITSDEESSSDTSSSTSGAQSTYSNSTSNLSRRIVGGGKIGTGGFDFIIGFAPNNPKQGVKGCTGVLIAPKYLLTTQACIGDGTSDKSTGSKLVLAIGTTDENLKKKSFTNFSVVNTYSSTHFPPVGYYNHIALMELDKEVPDSVARPVKIFASDQTNDIPSILVGYAAESTQTSAISLTDMRQAPVSLDSSEYCQDALDNINGKTELCSRTTAGLNTCAVDYGTPLLTTYEIPVFSGLSLSKMASGTQTGYALLGLTTYAYHNANALMNCVYGSQIGFYTWVYPFIKDIAAATGLDESELVVGNLTYTQESTLSSSSSSSKTSKTSSKPTSSSASDSSGDDDSSEQQGDDGEGEVSDSAPISQMIFTPDKSESTSVKSFIVMFSTAIFTALAIFI